MEDRVGSVVVVGAGVTGLTTAICLVEAGWRVRLLAALPPHLSTSIVAGALWGPSFQQPSARTLAWTRQSLLDLVLLSRHPGTGVRMAAALTVGELPPADRLPPQVTMIPDLRPAEPAELPAGFAGGFRATMPLVDMPRYLDYLVERLRSAGVELEIRTLSALDEAAELAPVVVNCAGLGAGELAGDTEVRPVFGQHVVLTNPGLTDVFLELTTAQGAAEWTSFFPHPERVVCGGISLPDRTEATPDDAVTERILARCRAVEPRLASADVIETVVGLRPDRPAVRVEIAPLGRARCVHNYGHGGNGVSLSWGCAREVAELLSR